MKSSLPYCKSPSDSVSWGRLGSRRGFYPASISQAKLEAAVKNSRAHLDPVEDKSA